jgi:DNA-binding NtrC family response regulator
MTMLIILPTLENIYQAAMVCRKKERVAEHVLISSRKDLHDKIYRSCREYNASLISIFAPFDFDENLENALKELSGVKVQVDWYGAPNTKLQEQLEKISNTRTHIGLYNLFINKEVRDYLQLKKALTFLGDENSKLAINHLKEAINNISAAPKTVPIEDKKSVEMFSEMDSPAIEGRSEKILELKKAIHSVANASLNKVLLLGETGTGKEAAAFFLHLLDPARRNEKFGSVNCATLQEDFLISELFGHVKGAYTGAINERKGLIAELDHGTVFLDELPDLPPRAQTMLLRFLQSGTYSPLGSNEQKKANVKIVTGGQKSLLHEKINAKEFRKDLYFRLAGKTITLPNLSEIPGDLGTLIVHLAYKMEANSAVRDETISYFYARMEELKAHSWPGNVRELANYVKRRLKLGKAEHIDLQEFRFMSNHASSGDKSYQPPASSEMPITYNYINLNLPLEKIRIDPLKDVYKNYIVHIYTYLAKKGLPKRKIAEMLGISVNTLKKNIPQN